MEIVTGVITAIIALAALYEAASQGKQLLSAAARDRECLRHLEADVRQLAERQERLLDWLISIERRTPPPDQPMTSTPFPTSLL